MVDIIKNEMNEVRQLRSRTKKGTMSHFKIIFMMKRLTYP